LVLETLKAQALSKCTWYIIFLNKVLIFFFFILADALCKLRSTYYHKQLTRPQTLKSMYFLYVNEWKCTSHMFMGGRRGHDCILVGFTVTYAISAYRLWRCEFESRSGEVYSIQHICDKVCQWVVAGRCFSPVSSNKADRHDITEIVLKVALITIIPSYMSKGQNVYIYFL
jgi:hypothetical protein